MLVWLLNVEQLDNGDMTEHFRDLVFPKSSMTVTIARILIYNLNNHKRVFSRYMYLNDVKTD